MGILFLIISIFVVLLSRYLFKYAFGNLQISKYMPHTHLFYVQLILFSLIGSNLMIFGIRTNIIGMFIQDDLTYIVAILGIYYTLITMPICIIIYNNIFKFNIKKNNNKYLTKSSETFNNVLNKYYFMFFSVMTVVSVFFVIYLIYYKAPLFMYLTGQLNKVLSSRIAYSRNFGGSLLIKNVIGKSIVPLVSYILFGFFWITKSKKWRNLFAINFICAIFVNGADLSKSGVVYYLIPYIYLVTIIDNKIPYRKIIKYGILGFFILVFMYTIQYANAGITYKDVILDFYGGPIGRVLLVQIQSFSAYLEIFPKYANFLIGKSIAIFRFLGLPFIESARVVAQYIEPTGVQAGWVGVASTIFLGDAYANFGMLGIIFSPIWVSFIFSFFYSKLLKAHKNPINIGYYIFILDNLTNSLTGGFFSAYVINTRIIVAFLFVIVIKFSVQIFTRSTKATQI